MTAPLVDIRGLTKSFNGNVVLDHIDLQLERGSTTAVVGASGCGKTTLLRLIAGFETPARERSRSTADRSRAPRALSRRTDAASAMSHRTARCSRT